MQILIHAYFCIHINVKILEKLENFTNCKNLLYRNKLNEKKQIIHSNIFICFLDPFMHTMNI